MLERKHQEKVDAFIASEEKYLKIKKSFLKPPYTLKDLEKEYDIFQKEKADSQHTEPLKVEEVTSFENLQKSKLPDHIKNQYTKETFPKKLVVFRFNSKEEALEFVERLQKKGMVHKGTVEELRKSLGAQESKQSEASPPSNPRRFSKN